MPREDLEQFMDQPSIVMALFLGVGKLRKHPMFESLMVSQYLKLFRPAEDCIFDLPSCDLDALLQDCNVNATVDALPTGCTVRGLSDSIRSCPCLIDSPVSRISDKD